MRKMLLLLLLPCGLFAQAPPAHTVTLTWNDAVNPAGTTYSVLKALGLNLTVVVQ